MTPPINIDGSTVDAITIDGTEVTEVTADGEVVFGSAIPDSAVARWTFDNADTDGSTAEDIWGGNDGTINGATTGVSGQLNEAYDFDQTGDNVDTSLSVVPTPMSVSVWVNLNSYDDFGAIISNFTGSFESGVFAIQLADDSSSLSMDLHSTRIRPWGSISTNSWTQLVVTYDESNIEVYQDGSSVTSASETDTSDLDNANVRVGQHPNDSFSVDARIDDARFYSKALSSTEVSNLYNTGEIDG